VKSQKTVAAVSAIRTPFKTFQRTQSACRADSERGEGPLPKSCPHDRDDDPRVHEGGEQREGAGTPEDADDRGSPKDGMGGPYQEGRDEGDGYEVRGRARAHEETVETLKLLAGADHPIRGDHDLFIKIAEHPMRHPGQRDQDHDPPLTYPLWRDHQEPYTASGA